MPTFTSADLLTRFNELSGRGASDTLSDTVKYRRLADAQNVVLADAASRVPKAFVNKGSYSAMPTLTTSDSQVFTFGTDVNGDPLFPIGKVEIYPSLSSVPDSPWIEGVDYLNEGTQIRIPSNRTWGGTLYWRGIAPVLPIDATNQPSIIPPPFRMLIVYEAVRRFAEEGKADLELADRMATNYQRMFAQMCLVLKTQFSNGGALGGLSGRNLTFLGSSLSA
jgi:hypothetical protein